jgi:hypothetical protein
MRALLVFPVILAGLGGCADIARESDLLAREAAKNVVNDVIEARLPGLDARAATDCVIDNATGPEVVQIAQSAMLGATPATTDLVFDIAQRPATVGCISDRMLGTADFAGLFG